MNSWMGRNRMWRGIRQCGVAGLAALGAVFAAAPAAACGPDTDCAVTDASGAPRAYRIDTPAAVEGAGAILFAHGYRGSAKGVMRNRGLRAMAAELGVALIALDAGIQDWRLPNRPRDPGYDGVAEISYVAAVAEDAAARFGLDPGRMMITGFSAGGMLTWTIACRDGGRFFAATPIAGTFWAPEPTQCPSPSPIIQHIHGDADPVVPLAGRQIADTAQGDVDRVLTMVIDRGGFGAPEPLEDAEGLSCQRRVNGEERVLDFCLFSGGHSFSIRHLRLAWERAVDLAEARGQF